MYTKQGFVNHDTENPLTAEQLIAMEEGIIKAFYPKRNYGKSIAVFGGSMSTPNATLAEVAQEIWKEYLNLSITNYGVSGAGFLAYITEGTTIPEQVDKAGVHDIYLLHCSSNDYRNNIPNGDVTDIPASIDAITTQAGGINWCIKRIYEINPNAEIYLFTSTRFWYSGDYSEDSGYNPFSEEGNNYGLNLQDYVDMQKKCCERFSIPYLDAFNLLGVNDYNYDKLLTSDKLHISERGYQILGYAQAQFLANGLG